MKRKVEFTTIFMCSIEDVKVGVSLGFFSNHSYGLDIIVLKTPILYSYII